MIGAGIRGRTDLRRSCFLANARRFAHLGRLGRSAPGSARTCALALFALLLVSGQALADQIVYGRHTLVCFPYDRAMEYAERPSSNEIAQALGCGPGYRVRITRRGADNCRPCASGTYKCQGYVHAVCEPVNAGSGGQAAGAAGQAAGAAGAGERLIDGMIDRLAGRAGDRAHETARPDWPQTDADAAIRRIMEESGWSAEIRRIQRTCDEDLFRYWDPRSGQCRLLQSAETDNARFGTTYDSGGAGVHVFTYGAPGEGTVLRLSWDHKSIPDRIVVFFVDHQREWRIVDTGMVSYTGTRELPPFHGHRIKLVVTGGGDNTAWSFRLAGP